MERKGTKKKKEGKEKLMKEIKERKRIKKKIKNKNRIERKLRKIKKKNKGRFSGHPQPLPLPPLTSLPPSPPYTRGCPPLVEAAADGPMGTQLSGEADERGATRLVDRRKVANESICPRFCQRFSFFFHVYII